MAKFPEPPTTLPIPPASKTLLSGSVLWRVYFAGGSHPAAWNTFRFFGPTAARFDQHDPPPQVQAKGIMYAASHPDTCLAEVFQATRLIDRGARSPWLVGFRLQKDVTLLNLTGTWPTQAGASMAINSGPRPRARRWSQLIYQTYPAIEGLYYGSSMNANKPSVALYERGQQALPVSPVVHRALADPSLLPRIGGAAKRLGYKLV